MEVAYVFEERAGDILSGCLKCECSIFPIVNGILVLKNTLYKDLVIKYIKQDRTKEALSLSLYNYSNEFYRIVNFINLRPYGSFFGGSLLKLLEYVADRSNIKFTCGNKPFFKAIGNGLYEVYLKYRISSPTFWSLYPFIPLFKGKKRRILDVCCGAGHASFVLSSYVNPDELVCVDGDYRGLFLARKYFSKAQFINLDVNYPLPFKSNAFSAILLMDAFQYVDAKALLAKELERLVLKDGIYLILHLHNSLVPNVAAGKPLSPRAWNNLFDSNNIKLLAEHTVIEDFILRGCLDLSRNYAQKELDSSSALIIIQGADLKCYDNVWDDILSIRNNLIVNPLYSIDTINNKTILNRKFPSEHFKTEYPLLEKILPETYEISARIDPGRKLCNIDKECMEKLIRDFILLNVPSNYIN